MNSEQRVRFVTGANSRYFFVCGILLESLNEFFPEIEAQFFDTKKKLVRRPQGLKKDDHPYKLKSSMHSFLAEQFPGTSIWVDADIIAVNTGQSELFEI